MLDVRKSILCFGVPPNQVCTVFVGLAWSWHVHFLSVLPLAKRSTQSSGSFWRHAKTAMLVLRDWVRS